MNIIWTYCIHHVVNCLMTYQHQLKGVTAIHKSSPVASWESKVSIICTFQNHASFLFFCLLYSKVLCEFECSPEYYLGKEWWYVNWDWSSQVQHESINDSCIFSKTSIRINDNIYTAQRVSSLHCVFTVWCSIGKIAGDHFVLRRHDFVQLQCDTAATGVVLNQML